MITYLSLYIVYFFVPGFLVAHIAGLGRLAWLLFLPLSYALLIVNLFLAKLFEVDVTLFQVVLNLEIAALIAGFFVMKARKGLKFRSSIQTGLDTLSKRCQSSFDLISIVAGLFGVLIVYFLWVGPYTEVPSDFWSHVGIMQSNYLSLVTERVFPGLASWREFGDKGTGYWYAIQAFLCYTAGITVEQSYAPQALINSMVILGAVFAFAVRVLEGGELAVRGRYIVAAIATLFFLTHFGTNVFSFVRYYTFGPVLLNYVVYLVFTVLVLELLGKSPHPKWPYFLLLVLFFGLMAVIHIQEAMFAAILGYSMLFFFWLKRSVQGIDALEGAGGDTLSRRQLDWLFYLVTLLILVGSVVAHLTLNRHSPMAYNRMINLQEIIPFLRHMYVLDPAKQFYETLTPWGYLVVLLFFLNWGRFKNNPVLVVGMLSPFYTVLNPYFTDLFLRVSWPELLWRLLYMAPLYIVGALLVYRGATWLKENVHPVKKVYGCSVIFAILFLLFPVDTKYFQSSYSKFQTLKPVKLENNYTTWADLYEFLNSITSRFSVLTDPITGYTLRALTHHQYFGAKFLTIRWGGYQNMNQRSYSLTKYRNYDGWILIINQRDGSHSKTGEISRHWRSDQLQVSKYYDKDFISFVEEHPDNFKRIWSRERVDIYKIHI